MASRRTNRYASLGQLWQVPTLAVAVGLFGFAAYKFIDPKAGPTIDQKVDVARGLLKAERPEAAINALNRLVSGENLDRDHNGTVHLMMGAALQTLQQQKHLSLRTYHEQIVEHTLLAESYGVKPTYEIERRLGESCEAIGQTTKALDHYRQAAAMDPTHALRLQRKVIELQLATDDGAADASLERYAADPQLSDGERAWALCNRAKLLVDQKRFVQARDLLDKAAAMEADAGTAGQVTYFRGYCAAKTGDAAGAEALLRTARQQLRSDNPLDADAACLLGQLSADRGDPRTAVSFYADVIVNHPGSTDVPTALLGRGLALLTPGTSADDAGRGLSDLKELARRVLAMDPAPATTVSTAAAGLSQGAAALSNRDDAAGALELLDGQRQLTPKPPAAYYHQLSAAFERRADQVERGTSTDAAAVAARTRDGRAFRISAADASVTEAGLLTVTDDKAAGVALWRGIDLYDRAAELPAAIDALNLFVAERPSDPLAPRALLQLGRDYQATGQTDRAIATYQRAQASYPNTLEASQSALPLAAAYESRGPADYPRAEAVLRGVIEGNPLLSPAADEYRQALFELGKLYYRTDRYEPAIVRLTEWSTRYGGDDARAGQALFLTADSYRKSAARLAAKGSTTRPAEMAEAAATRRDRLEAARVGYDAVVAHFKKVPAVADLDRTYDRQAHFDRADCLYDTGRYEEAIRQYDAAAFQYDTDPAAMAAYVQIVNAYHALGKPDEANAANERAKVMLRQIPPESFTSNMPKAYWENQLRWNSSGGGMW